MQANRRSTYRDEKNLQVAAAAAAGSDVHYRRIVIQHVVRSDYWLAASCQRHQVVVGMETLSYERRRWQRHDGCADDGRAQHHVLLAVARHSEMVHHGAVTSFWQWHATLRWFTIAPSRPSGSGMPLWDGSSSRRHVLLTVARHSEMVHHRAAHSHRPRHCRQYILRHHTPEPNVSKFCQNLGQRAVLQNPMFHKSSTSFILSALAVADAVMVNTGLLRFWIYFKFDVDVRAFTSFGCKFHIMLTYYIHQVSELLLSLSYLRMYQLTRLPPQIGCLP